MSTQADLYTERTGTEKGVYLVIVLQQGQGCVLEKDIVITAVTPLDSDLYAQRVILMLSWFFAPIVLFLLFLALERYRGRGFAFNEPEANQDQTVSAEDPLEADEVGSVWLQAVPVVCRAYRTKC